VPVVECDPETARDRLERAGVRVEPGNTDHELWRAGRDGATAVAYEGKVVVQGSDPSALTLPLREGGGRGHVRQSQIVAYCVYSRTIPTKHLTNCAA